MPTQAATLAQVFHQQAQKYADRVYLKDKHHKQWRDHSWREIADAAARLRAGLIQLGVKAGDRVGILADNCPQWVITDQAALGAGAIVVPLYTTSNVEEIGQILLDSGASIVAARGDDNVKKMIALAPQLKALEGVIAIHAGATESSHSFGGSSLPIRTLESVSQGDPAGVFEGSGEDIATIIYTSGTSGPPKGVMLSHGNLIANCQGNVRALDLGEHDMTLSFLPMAHSFERTAGYYTVMMAGGSTAYAEGLGQIADNLRETNPTVVLTVPRLLEVVHERILRTIQAAPAMRQRLFAAALAVGKRAAFYRHRGLRTPPHVAAAMALFRRLVFARIRGLFGNRLRYLISGGAPLPTEIFEFLSAAEVPISEGYGLTEASPVVSCNLHGRTRIGTVGQPLYNLQVKTANDGELLIHGPSVMKGYYKRDDETRESIDADGWLHTGDIAVIDADGFIAIKDRKKEIIVLSGGKNVSPANVEARLVADPYIAQACVVGNRRKHLAALIVPNFETLAEYVKQQGVDGTHEKLVEEAAVRNFYQQRVRDVNKNLSTIDAIVAFRLLSRPFSQDNGELTPTLKVRRRMVEQHYRDEIESMYGR
ncbi:MAG TPA: long-chain fatty acid--CoA ligase [Candidatus Binataceae bacterium]|nr:long-chain fatty acid--CoA ligase [Candidatus Binataceae bacterium]